MNGDDETLRTAYANLERLTIEQAIALSPRFENIGDLMDEGVTINSRDWLDLDWTDACSHVVGDSMWVSRDDIALAEFGRLTGSCA